MPAHRKPVDQTPWGAKRRGNHDPSSRHYRSRNVVYVTDAQRQGAKRKSGQPNRASLQRIVPMQRVPDPTAPERKCWVTPRSEFLIRCTAPTDRRMEKDKWQVLAPRGAGDLYLKPMGGSAEWKVVGRFWTYAEALEWVVGQVVDSYVDDEWVDQLAAELLAPLSKK
jgi:hypothetical protein